MSGGTCVDGAPTATCPAAQAVFHAERGLEWVVFAQQHQHPVVTALANWSCATVTVVFYATFLPILVCAHLHLHNALHVTELDNVPTFIGSESETVSSDAEFRQILVGLGPCLSTSEWRAAARQSRVQELAKLSIGNLTRRLSPTTCPGGVELNAHLGKPTQLLGNGCSTGSTQSLQA